MHLSHLSSLSLSLSLSYTHTYKNHEVNLSSHKALHYSNFAVSAITCYEGFGPRTQVTDNSTVKLREGELLVLHCITNSDVYELLHMPSCKTPPGLTAPDINTIGFCKITETYTSIVVHGFLKNIHNEETLLEFEVETYNLEQCLAQADALVTPSPCTTLPHSTDPAINTSTTPTISTTETVMTTSTETPTTTATTATAITTTSTDATDPSDTRDPIETTVPEINNPDRIQQNDTTADVNQYLIYSVIGVLCVMVLVQFLVIVLLAVYCRKRRQKVVEEGETGTERRHEMRRISQLSLDKSVTIVNTGSINGEEAPMDNSRERVEGEKVEGATGTDQQQETRRISLLSSCKDNAPVRASVEGETITNVLNEETKEEEGVETGTKKQQEEEEEEEDNQHSSDVIKETATASGGTCSIGAKERDIASGGSVDSVNDSTPTTKPC